MGRPLHRQRWRWLAALAVPVAMLAVAGPLGRHQLIFPEGAALAFAVLGLRLEDWDRSPAALALLPAAAALAGVGLVHAGGPRPLEEIAAVAAVLLALRMARSRLTPTISAAVLPLVFDVRSWAFPAAVAVIGATLAAASWPRRHHRTGPAKGPLPARAAVTGWVIAAGWIAVAGPGLGLAAAALAPPLIVATVERLARRDRSTTLGLRQWTLTVGAAAAGAGLPVVLRPVWVGGIAAVALTLAVIVVSATPHPPALAVSLIPQITADRHPVSYVAAVALGAAVLYLAADLAVRWPARPRLRVESNGARRSLARTLILRSSARRPGPDAAHPGRRVALIGRAEPGVPELEEPQ